MEPINKAQSAEAEALFTSIGDGAISTDEFGRITRVNPVAQRILGFSERELLGEWFPKKIIATDADGTPINLIDRPITQAFLTGEPVSNKLYYRMKNGQSVPVSVNVSPILVGDNPRGAIELFRDITLEQEVDRMKSEFISLASHQLRTPLSAIKTYSHMLVEGYMGEVTDDQRKSLKTIISSANRMNDLISTLLNITRMESGTITVMPKPLHVDVIGEEVIKELSHLASDNNVNLSCRAIGKRPMTVRTDSLILKEIITNLVSNGLKYTPAGGDVLVTSRSRGSKIIVEVKDTGWGIPVDSQEQIFSKFFRAQNIVRRETTGTGLGLYLVKGLVEAIGGDIWFESEEGAGTTFYVSLDKPKQRAKKATKQALKT